MADDALFSLLPTASFESWGWRIPFLCSGLLVLVGLWVRTQLEETPQFRAIGATRNQDEWYAAFGAKPGDKYYLAPDQRVHFW